MVAALRRREEAVGETVERLGGDPLDADPALLLPARELAPGAVEFAVAGQDPKRPAPRGAAVTSRIRKSWVLERKDDCAGVVGAKLARDIGLGLGPDLVHHLVPLAVGEPRGVIPCRDLAVEARVGPQMMAVRGEVQPVGIGAAGSAEQRLEAQRSVLSDHSSGNTRLSRVERDRTRRRSRRCRACCR